MKKKKDFKLSFTPKSHEELWDKKEKLHKDLRPYLSGSTIHHPLHVSIFHHESQNALVNQLYRYKLENLEHCKSIQDWTNYAFIHERPYRLESLVNAEMEGHVEDFKEWWKALARVWVDSENIWQNHDDWEYIFGMAEEDKNSKHFMTPDERKAFKALPEEFEVYRGYHVHKSAVTNEKYNNQKGFSWTLSREKAEWFAKRFQRNEGRVDVMKVNKSEVFAYMGSRNEEEVILFKEALLKETTTYKVETAIADGQSKTATAIKTMFDTRRVR